MSNIFITILNMSVTASFAAVFVIFARLLLKKAPKIFSYALWAVVLFRMLYPFSFESVLSILPAKPEPIPQDIVTQVNPRIDSGIIFIDNAVNNILPAPASVISTDGVAHAVDSVNPLQILAVVSAYVWLFVIFILFSYAVISYIKTKRRIFIATLIRDNIFETDRIKSPFVLGFSKPRIYLPVGIGEAEADYIIKHEQTHIRRGDHIIKLLAFIGLALHWFNPLMWASYFLMTKDMELSCDESVIKRSSEDIRSGYSATLLSLSVKQSGLPNPLAFGESNVKSRIKNVLSFKKPVFWISVVSVILVFSLTVALAGNQIKSQDYGFSSQDLSIGVYTVSFELPNDFGILAMKDIGLSEVNLENIFIKHSDLFYNEDGIFIVKYGEVIGKIALMPVHVTKEMFDTYKENPEQNFRAIFYPMPMGSMNFAGVDYKVVYENETRLEGAATDYIYYSGDFLKNFTTDLSHFGSPFEEEFANVNYYNKSVLGYNLDLNRIAVIELYYDSVTDEELRRIAETLRITGETRTDNEFAPHINLIDFNVSIRPEQYNENPFGGNFVNEIFRSKEKLEAYCGNEVYAVTATDGVGNENIYLRPLIETYNDEYFKSNALVAISFKANQLGIPVDVVRIDKSGGTLDVWMNRFEDMRLPENGKWTTGAYDTRVFLIEVNKADVEGFMDIQIGVDEPPLDFELPPPDETPAIGVEFINEIYNFIAWHHGFYVHMNNDELLPDIITLYAIWRTYQLETALGTEFEPDEVNFGWKIPEEMVKNVVSHLYNLDGNAFKRVKI